MEITVPYFQFIKVVGRWAYRIWRSGYMYIMARNTAV